MVTYLAGNRIRGTSTERGNYPVTITDAWDLSTAVEVGDEFSGTSINNFFMKPDGTKLYTIYNNASVKEYSLSVAFDITSTLTNTYTMSISHGTDKLGLFIGDSGTKMYIGTNGTDSIYQYNLSAAWDLSTASDSGNSKACSCIFPSGIVFKSDGTEMFVTAPANYIQSWSLTTAWDLSSATKDSTESLSDTVDVRGLFIKSDGLKFWCCDVNSSHLEINEYSLSTAWDFSTISYESSTTMPNYPNNIMIKSDGTKMFVAIGGTTNGGVYQYDIGTSSVDTIQNGAIFEETDTNKHYLLDDGTWTEI